MMRHSPGHITKTAHGFTLLEFVITLVILGIVAAIIGKPLANFLAARSSIDRETTLQTDVDYALARMATAIRAGKEVQNCISESSNDSNSESEPQLIVDGETYENPQNSDELRLDSQVLLKDVDSFSCDEVGSGLRLYSLSLVMQSGEGRAVYKVRAFQRDES